MNVMVKETSGSSRFSEMIRSAPFVSFDFVQAGTWRTGVLPALTGDYSAAMQPGRERRVTVALAGDPGCLRRHLRFRQLWNRTGCSLAPVYCSLVWDWA